MSELPAFPDRNNFTFTRSIRGAFGNHERFEDGFLEVDYERARAEAAIARLKVAVEALSEIGKEERASNAAKFVAMQAVGEIGPLP
jgi:hypothetical protein